MRILIVRTHPTKIHIGTYNVQEIGLAKALVRKGNVCDVALFTDEASHDEDLQFDKKLSIVLHWIHGKNVFWQGIYNKKEIERLASDYDVIQVNEYNQLASYYISERMRDKCVIYHGPYYNPNDKKYNFLNKGFDIFFLNKMCRSNVPILTKSRLAQQTLEGRGFRKVTTVGVGIDIERFGTAYDRRDNDLKYESVKIASLLYIGEISERRNTLFLLELVNSLSQSKEFDIRLRIIGKGKDEYTKKCFDYINEHNLQNVVDYIPTMKQEELPAVYKEANIFLLPSSYEIFGMVLLESMYFEVPVISTVNGGSSTLIEDGLDGIIAERLDVNVWHDKITKLLRDPSMRKRIGEKAHKKVIEGFTWDAIADKMLLTYRQVWKEG